MRHEKTGKTGSFDPFVSASPPHEGTAEALFGLPTEEIDALAEALRLGGDAHAAAVELGATAAAEAIGWSELLSAVEDVARAVTGSLPPYEVVRAMSVAWTDTALQGVYETSCEDPLTGLTTAPHLRTRLDDAYRLAERSGRVVSDLWAFVVVELVDDPGPDRALLRSLSMAALGDLMRACFDGDETLARLGERRAVAMVARDDATRGWVALRRLLDETPDLTPSRVWIEGLPWSSTAASRLLEELSRSTPRPGG